MQFRPDVGNGPGLTLRRTGPGPPFPAPPLRGGFPVDYGPRVDDRRYTVVSSRLQQQQQELPPPKSSQGGDDQEEAPPSRHLWVGNVSQEVTENLLIEKFSTFGPIESVTVYSQRNYAFINFRNVANAQDAKNGLQGVVLGGLAMRIEFAKGAKPSRHLWVGGICQTVSKEQIEGEFKRFGMLEDFKFLRDRNCAFVDYEKIEDAIAAVDSLNRKLLGDEELRVDFGRSQPPKREGSGRPGTATSYEEWGGPPSRDGRDLPDLVRVPAETYKGLPDGFRQSERGSSGDSFRGPSEVFQAGAGPGTVVSASGRSRGEREEPSDVLWVGFPLLSKVDEEGLRRAFVPYGEVERVKTFPGRTYAFVQFKNVEEASRAKIALEGKLFNDPRVHIRFSNSEIGPVDNPRTDGLMSPSRGREPPSFSEKVIGRVVQSDRFCSIIPPLRPTGLRPEYYPGGLARGAALARAVGSGAGISLGRGLGRSLGQGVPDGRIPLEERETSGSQGTKGLSGSGVRSLYDEQWDLPEEEIMAREPKRARVLHVGATDSAYNSSFEGGKRFSDSDSFGSGPEPGREGYGVSSSLSAGLDDYTHGTGLSRVRLGPGQFDRTRLAGVGQAHTQSGTSPGSSLPVGFAGVGKRDGLGTDSGVAGINEGWRWHGTIAKGGTPVCRARCLPVGKGIDVTVPDVVNCTARTDLDMLAKHVYQAGDFGVVFFVPEADPDVPPYYDFMHYLGEKRRAGVAKLVDGTTLFLVPPSEFSEQVLKVPGNNCLFGVVLKSQQQTSLGNSQQQMQSSAAAPQQHHQPRQLPQQPVSLRQQHSQSQGPAFANGHPTQDSGIFPGASHQGQVPVSAVSSTMLSQTQLNSLAGGIPTVLTPELIASLTALLPQQDQPPAAPGPFPVPGSNMHSPPAREGMGAGGVIGRVAPNSGSTIPAQTTMDNRSSYRSLQSNQQSMIQPQAWLSGQPEQQPGGGGHMGVPPEQGFSFVPTQQLQSVQAPHVSVVQQPPSGPLPGQVQHGFLGSQSQGFSGSGYSGQQLLQQPRPPQHPPPQLGGAPMLPSDQLAQLTALLTQRQQQPAQQQQAAQLLQQHYQQQQPLISALSQQSTSLPSLQTLSQCYNQQLQPQHYASQASSQNQWTHGGPLSQHSSHLPGAGTSGAWDGATTGQVQQPQHQAQPPMPTQQPPHISIPQPLPTGGAIADHVGVAQDDTERQKRFQATLQLAAALLQQMQHQQTPGQGNNDQR